VGFNDSLGVMDLRFIALGSGEVLPWELHSSLTLLHQLKLFGFPIPSGLIVLDVYAETGSFPATARQTLETQLQERGFKDRVALSCFHSKEGELKVIRQPSQKISTALDELESTCQTAAILILDFPQATIYGTAFSEKGYQDDLLEFSFADVGTAASAQLLPIEKLNIGETNVLSDFRGRVQDLLRSVRKVLGEDNWKISWADDGAEVFLTAIERILNPLVRSETFADIPALQILPTPVNPLTGSLAASCSAKLFQYLKNWNPDLAPQRQFIKFESPRVLFNFSLLSDFIRGFGLSDKTLHDLSVNVSMPTHSTNGLRFWKNLPRFLRLCHDANLGLTITKKVNQKLQNFDTTAEKTFSELFLEWQTIYVSSSHSLFRLLERNFLILNFFRFLGLSRALQSPRNNWGARLLNVFFFPIVKQRIHTERLQTQLTRTTWKALQKIQSCLHVKSLGLYSKGIFQSPEQLWFLNVNEVIQIDKGWRPDADFWRERFLEINENSHCSTIQSE